MPRLRIFSSTQTPSRKDLSFKKIYAEGHGFTMIRV